MNKGNAIAAIPIRTWSVAAILGSGLVLLNALFGYLAFHALAELFTIVVASSLFMVVWYARQRLTSDYLLLVGIGFAAAGALDALHMLSYPGMGVFSLPNEYDTSMQLWLAARFVQAATLAVAPLFLRRKLRAWVALAAYTSFVIVCVALTLIWPTFPGLLGGAGGHSPLYVISEYVIVALFGLAILLIERDRAALDDPVRGLLIASIAAAMVSEVAFTIFSDPFGLLNLVGHLLKMLSFFLIAKATVESALTRPYGVLFRELARAKELAEAMIDLDVSINSTLDFDTIMSRVIVKSAEALRCDSAMIAIREGEYWIPRYQFRFPAEIIGRQMTPAELPEAELAAQTGCPVAVSEAVGDARVNSETAREFGIQSLIAVPLMLRGSCIGMLDFYFHDTTHRFTDEELYFASSLGAALALAIENARVYATERVIADALQTWVLTMPATLQGVSIAHAYQSSEELARIGGDFIDAFEIDERLVAFAVGDVSGKGLRAATLTSRTKTAIRTLAYQDWRPSNVLTRANRALGHQLGEEQFVTVVYAVLDRSSGSLTVASAGHPAPILISGRTRKELEIGHAPPLGLFPGATYDEASTVVREEEVVLLYSDGVLDARNESEFFGESGLDRAVARARNGSPHSIVRTILDAVTEYSPNGLADDVAVVAFKRTH